MRDDYRRAVVRFAECRNLLGGVTTGHGLYRSRKFPQFSTYFKGLMRNIEQPLDPSLPEVRSQTLDMTVEEIEEKYLPWVSQGKPFVYHLCEGVGDSQRQPFLGLKQAGLAPSLVSTHCVALKRQDFDELSATAGTRPSPPSTIGTWPPA